ncbi:hypothetical protein [Streptomyces sp. NPDC091027]|uniref:hypothetical protein n=1 Tax=Streptomyces sp. NPDC091027 TaxID=3365971 RepID=UPI00380F8831
MLIELDFPEFPYAEPRAGITCQQKPWNGVLDTVTEGSIIAFYTLTPSDGGAPSTSQEAIVHYSRQQPGGSVCGRDN